MICGFFALGGVLYLGMCLSFVKKMCQKFLLDSVICIDLATYSWPLLDLTVLWIKARVVPIAKRQLKVKHCTGMSYMATLPKLAFSWTWLSWLPITSSCAHEVLKKNSFTLCYSSFSYSHCSFVMLLIIERMSPNTMPWNGSSSFFPPLPFRNPMISLMLKCLLPWGNKLTCVEQWVYSFPDTWAGVMLMTQ